MGQYDGSLVGGEALRTTLEKLKEEQLDPIRARYDSETETLVFGAMPTIIAEDEEEATPQAVQPVRVSRTAL